MMWYVGVLGTLRFWLNFGLFLVAAYLAVATNLSSKKVPSEDAWLPWHPLFVSVVAAGIYVAFVAFYNYMRTQGAAQKERNTDVNIACQEIAWLIIDRCKSGGLDPGLLAVGVWLTRKNNKFDRKAPFLLPAQRPPSGVKWEHGKGVAGSLWASGEGSRWERLADRSTMTAAGYDGLPEDERLGMTYAEWGKVKAYNGVVAVALYAASASLLGFLVVDYRGPLKPVGGSDLVDCIGQAVSDPGLMSQYLGSLVSLLEKRV